MWRPLTHLVKINGRLVRLHRPSSIIFSLSGVELLTSLVLCINVLESLHIGCFSVALGSLLLPLEFELLSQLVLVLHDHAWLEDSFTRFAFNGPQTFFFADLSLKHLP